MQITRFACRAQSHICTPCNKYLRDMHFSNLLAIHYTLLSMQLVSYTINKASALQCSAPEKKKGTDQHAAHCAPPSRGAFVASARRLSRLRALPSPPPRAAFAASALLLRRRRRSAYAGAAAPPTPPPLPLLRRRRCSVYAAAVAPSTPPLPTLCQRHAHSLTSSVALVPRPRTRSQALGLGLHRSCR